MSREQKQIPTKDELNEVIKTFHTTLRQLSRKMRWRVITAATV